MTATVNQIICATAQEFGLTKEELLSRSREARIAHPRAISVQLAREFTKASYPVLGRAYGRHHSTIMHLVQRAHDVIDAFPELFDRRQAVIEKLGLTYG